MPLATSLNSAILGPRFAITAEVVQFGKGFLGDDEFVVVSDVFTDFQLGIMDGLTDWATVERLGHFSLGFGGRIRWQDLGCTESREIHSDSV